MFGGGPRQQEINDAHLMQTSGKIPPGWDPARDKQYPYRFWIIDVRLWAAATDVPINRQGAAVALRLSGAAKLLVREFDADILVNGQLMFDAYGNPIIDANGAQVHMSGLDVLLREMGARYAPLEQETQIFIISELLSFKRYRDETTDDLISRFVITHSRAQIQLNNVAIPHAVRAWMILTALHYPRERWTVLLSPTQGMLPQNGPQFEAFLLYLRRQGHLSDPGDAMKTLHAPYFTQESAEQVYWGGTSNAYESSDNSHDMSSWGSHELQSHEQAYMSVHDEVSSCWSNDESIVDLSEFATVPTNTAGEQLYLGFRFAKRRFRRFQGRSKGGGKGKGGKRKGKSQRKNSYWNSETKTFEDSSLPEQTFYADDDVVWEWDDSTQVYFKGKGKGGKGKSNGMRKNPTGPDGKVMTCSVCNSENHFRAHCNKNPNPASSQSSSSLPSKGSSKGGYFGQSVPQPLPGYAPTYHATEVTQTAPTGSSMIEYSDGSVEVITPHAVSTPIVHGMFSFVWYLPSSFHSRVRLQGHKREGMLIDCGAVDNLAGSAWVDRVEKQANEHGQGTTHKTIAPVSVEGVGSGESRIDSFAVLPVKIKGMPASTFSTNVVANSELPGLLGLKSLTASSAVIDVAGKRMFYVGPGGYKLTLSPGSRTFALETAVSGHLLLPCTEWDDRQIDTGSKASENVPI